MSRFRKFKNGLFIGAVVLFTFISVLPLVHIILSITLKGAAITFANFPHFLIATFSEGGIGPAIVGTFVVVSISSLIAIPLAFLTGVYIYEYPKSPISRTLKSLLHLLLEIPTILIGIFVMAVLVMAMGRYSAVAGGIALAIIMIPYISTYTYEALNSIPFTYKEAAYSIGLRRIGVIFRIMVPIAKKGIITGIFIGIAKAAGETAPLLFTIGGLYESYPKSLLEPIGAVPLLIYTLVQSPSPEDHKIAWGASFVLLLIFLALFVPIRSMIKEVKL